MREYIFRMLSQTMISYHDSPISQGKAGEVRGGDRLPWVSAVDNYGSLATIAWQVHVYGAASQTLVAWCEKQRIALHRFDFSQPHAAAGLCRNAAYLLRPDSYIACVAADGSPALLDAYLKRCIRKARLT